MNVWGQEAPKFNQQMQNKMLYLSFCSFSFLSSRQTIVMLLYEEGKQFFWSRNLFLNLFLATVLLWKCHCLELLFVEFVFMEMSDDINILLWMI